MCVAISIFVLILLGYTMVKFRRGANPIPSRTSHNTLIEVIWTRRPGADPGRDRDPVDPPDQQAVQPAAGRR